MPLDLCADVKSIKGAIARDRVPSRARHPIRCDSKAYNDRVPRCAASTKRAVGGKDPAGK